MRVAILSESPADEAAIRIFADAILNAKAIVVDPAGIRQHGWPGVRNDLPGVIKSLYYHSAAESLVVVVDSDDTTPHAVEHEQPAAPYTDCRLCGLQRLAEQVCSNLRRVAGRPPFRVVVGLAVPAIEAWLLCDQQPHISETTWIQILSGRSNRYSRQSLKRAIYGTERPTLSDETKIMVRRATELASKIDILESRFPGGFGTLARTLRQT